MKIALLHHAAPPVVGGVESIIRQHARLFAEDGHEVLLLFGDGGGAAGLEGLQQHRLPLMSARHPEVLDLQSRLQAGELPDAFESMVDGLTRSIGTLLADCDLVIAHNLWVMPFHLALTAALWRLADQAPSADARGCPDRGGQRWISWVHDLAAARPELGLQERPEDHPAKLLLRHHPAVIPVAISELRRQQLIELLGVPASRCLMVPNGIEAPCFLPPLQPALADLARRDQWLERDLVLLQPTRLVPRKNIGFGIRVAGALRDQGVDFRYLVTAAEDPHRPARDCVHSSGLRAMARDSGVDENVLFLSDTCAVSDTDLAALYAYADVLFLPSSEEGFGLPLLEAATARLPVFCTRLQPALDILQTTGHFFSLSDNPAQVAQSLLEQVRSWPQFKARKDVVRRYSWQHIYRQHLKPLIHSA